MSERVAMERSYTYIPNLVAFQPVPEDGILSRTVYRDEQVKAVLFGLDAGQELSEHTASRPAIIQIVAGQACLTLANDELVVGPGAWVHLPANLRHSLKATTPVVMLLLLLTPCTS